MSWFDDFLNKFKPVGTNVIITIAGVNITQALGLQIIGWALANRVVLEAAGKDAFKNFLELWDQGKQDEAFEALLSSMDPDAVLAAITSDTAVDKTENDLHDSFKSSMIQFAFTVIEQTGMKVLIAALL